LSLFVILSVFSLALLIPGVLGIMGLQYLAVPEEDATIFSMVFVTVWLVASLLAIGFASHPGGDRALHVHHGITWEGQG